MRSGIGRGRIWTAFELRDLMTIPGLTQNDIERIGKVKVAFGADVLSVTPDVGEVWKHADA